jgi:excisionase family DNA binding protein
MPVVQPGSALLLLSQQDIIALVSVLSIAKKSGYLRDSRLQRFYSDLNSMATQMLTVSPVLEACTYTDITTKEAAAFIGVSTRRVQQLAKTGELQGHRVANGTWRFPLDVVHRYVAHFAQQAA